MEHENAEFFGSHWPRLEFATETSENKIYYLLYHYTKLSELIGDTLPYVYFGKVGFIICISC